MEIYDGAGKVNGVLPRLCGSSVLSLPRPPKPAKEGVFSVFRANKKISHGIHRSHRKFAEARSINKVTVDECASKPNFKYFQRNMLCTCNC